jgi:hypothetical protein
MEIYALHWSICWLAEASELNAKIGAALTVERQDNCLSNEPRIINDTTQNSA